MVAGTNATYTLVYDAPSRYEQRSNSPRKFCNTYWCEEGEHSIQEHCGVDGLGELGAISDLQAPETIRDNPDLTIGLDATTPKDMCTSTMPT